MSAVLTRRTLALAGAAALGAVVAPIAASAVPIPADPDASLVVLIARHGEALAACVPLDAACRPLLARFEAEAPERPAALLWRWSDAEHGVGPASTCKPARPGRGRGFFDHGDVERLRKAPALTKWGPYADDQEPYRVPDPVGETRRREIVEAHDAWMAERSALAERIGLTAANAASDSAGDVVCEVEIGILDHVPTTLAGFQAKARWISSTKNAEEWCVFLLRDLAGFCVVPR